jgi:heme/copper-type cytochrome/quinol oxidase subunit 3
LPKKVAAASSDENQQAPNMAGQSSQAQASLIDKDIRMALFIGLACFFLATLFIAFTRLDKNPNNNHP